MRLPFFIARRYLFSKAHRNVINIISAVSAVAIGIGCMALIIILSVYNGFDQIVESSYNSYIPDYIILPSGGKIIDTKKHTAELTDAEKIFKTLPFANVKVFEVLEETVYVQYEGVQSLAKIKGVPKGYDSLKRLESKIVEGKFATSFGSLNRAVVEEKLAVALMLRPQFSSSLEIYIPSRTEEISLIMPANSLLSEEIRPAGIIDLSAPADNGLIYVPDSVARNLLEYSSNECSKIEVYVESQGTEGARKKTSADKDIIKKIRKVLGDNFILRDRYQQNETVYKMMRAEKFAIYMILIFITIVISVNILSSLSMLIIEKKDDMETYRAMGMSDSTIRLTLFLHGWFICMVGAICGIIFGLILCWIQHRWGIIPLPGNFVVSSYPVVVKVSDVLITIVSIAAIGFVMAAIPVWRIKTKNIQK